EAYVALFQREHAGRLPANMAILYDYLTLQGDTTWYLPPAEVVSTKNVDSIRIANSGGGGTKQLTGPEVISAVLDTAAPAVNTQPVATAAPAPDGAAAKAKVKKASATTK